MTYRFIFDRHYVMLVVALCLFVISGFSAHSSASGPFATKTNAPLGIGLLTTEIKSTDPLDNWHWRNPLPQGNGFFSVAYGNNTFVALSLNILTSPDGMTWTPRTAKTFLDEGLFGVTYAKNMFVAVGGPICTSPDGVTWTQRSNPADWALNGVVGSDKTIVAVGFHGTIVTSSDGVTWTTRNSGTPIDLYGVTYGNNTFVAVGKYGTIVSSPDGVTWTTRNSGFTTLQSVTYAINTFVAVGYDGTILTSPDGLTWTARNSGTIYLLSSVTYAKNTFVAVGVFGYVLTSPDGVTWTTWTSGTPASFSGVTYGNDAFVAVGEVGTILTSPDGMAWTSRTSDLVGDVQIKGLDYGNNTFVAVGSDYQAGNFRDFIFTSPDGVAWTKTPLGTNYSLSGVATGSRIFVVVTAGGATLTSPDGITWTPNTSDVTRRVQFERVAYGNNTFVAAGWDYQTGNVILTSPDGVAWTVRASFEVYAIAYGNNTFLAGGNDNTGDVIFFSPDGVTWTKIQLGTNDGPSGVAAGNGIFVAVAGDGATFASSDGMTWTRRSDNVGFIPLTGVAYGNNTFVALGAPGFLFTSPDGVTWTMRPFDGGGSEGTLVYGNSTFVVVDNRDILQSDPVLPTPIQYTLTISESGSGSGTVTSQPPGISCGTTCSASFPQGTVVTLTANADPGSNFTFWNGCSSVNGSICEVNMTADKAITATFSLNSSSSPIITSISPTSGTVGTTVTTRGKYFGATQGSSTVSFNGVPVTAYTSWSDTIIKCTVPTGASTGPVVVTTTVGPSNGKTFTVNPPLITGLSPTSGTVGTTVTIRGKYFGATQGSSTVSFNGVPVTAYTSWSDTIIKCTVPTGASTGPVVVTTTVGPSNGKTFTVNPPLITGLSPTSGTVGTTVTIWGKYFGATQGSSTVSFNGLPVTTYTSWSDTIIKCTVPTSASTGPVVVTTTVGPSNGKTFTVNPPLITGLSPTSGTVGTTVTIRGKYFGATQGSSTVSFNGVPVTAYTSWSDTIIKCTVPTGASTGPVVVTTTVEPSNGKTFTVNP